MKLLRETSQDDPLAIAQMRQEATVGRCVSHRHLAPVLSAHIHRAPYYIVLPWLDGTNVVTHLKAHGRLEPATALWIVRQAAQALEALHTAGYTHGDVNPSNLLFTADGHVTLLDLGCSLRFDDGTAMSSPSTDDRLSGTPNYLVPEVFVGRGADGRSDLHSLGVTLFEMLAGRLPPMPKEIGALARLKRKAPLPDVRNYTPQLSEEVARFVKKLTAREPLRRPAHGADRRGTINALRNYDAAGERALSHAARRPRKSGCGDLERSGRDGREFYVGSKHL